MSSELPTPSRLRRSLRGLVSKTVEPLQRLGQLLPSLPARRETLWLTNASGYRIRVDVYEPDDQEPRAGVVLVPPAGEPGSFFCRRGAPVSAPGLAASGLRVVHFDPVGRGDSWGHDDFSGLEGQDSLRAALDFLRSRRNIRKLGVVSVDMGLSLAAPVLAREGLRLDVEGFIDWGGPADRDAIVRSAPLPPAARAALASDPASFWSIREPTGWIDQLPCRYVRLEPEDQSRSRRRQRGAVELVNRATQGMAKSTRLNQNPPDRAWREDQLAELSWIPAGSRAQEAQLTAALDDLLGRE